MSKSVKNAAAKSLVKAPVSKEKSTKLVKADDASPDKGDVAPHAADDEKETLAQAQPSMADGSSLGDFSFADALSEAADSASLIAAAQGDAGSSGDGDYSEDDDDGGMGVVLPVLLLAGVGGGVAAAAGGGGGNDGPPPNKAPTANASQSITVNEDGSKSGSVGASDPDGDSLTYSVSTAASNGSVALNGDNFTYTPNANYNGSDSFKITVSDGKGGSVIQTVNVTVNNVNDAPEAAAETAALTEDDAVLEGQLEASDIDGDDLSFSPILTAGGQFAPAFDGLTINDDGSYTFDPASYQYLAEDEELVLESGYIVDDGNGGSDSAAITITVTGVNDAPEFLFDDAEVAEVEEDGMVVAENAIRFGSDVTDAEGDTLTYSVVTPAMHGTFTVTPDGSTITYTPDPDYNGPDSATIQADDGNGGTDTHTFNINVTPVNDAPTVAAAQNVSLDEDSSVAVNVVGSDVDGDNLTYNPSDPTNGSVSGNTETGEFTYTPDPDFNGTDTFSVTVEDPGGLSATQLVTVTVNPLPETVSIDKVGPSQTQSAVVEAGDNEYIFTESVEGAATNTDVRITGFSDDDIIQSDAAQSAYSFGDADGGKDITVTLNDGTNFTQIILDDVVTNPGSVFVFTYESAVEAVGFNFMNFA